MTYKRLGNGDYTGGSPSINGTVLVGNFGEGKDLVARCKEMHFAPLTADYFIALVYSSNGFAATIIYSYLKDARLATLYLGFQLTNFVNV